ncbi:MAG: ubiquitin-like small modifier protein 1 [Haloarculaceae archaeon]
MEVIVYGRLRSATGQKQVTLEFTGGTVGDALQTFVSAYPRAKRHLYRDDGELAPSVRISINGETTDLEEACPPDASLSIHPAMRGG